MINQYREDLASGKKRLIPRTTKEMVKTDYFLAKGTHAQKLASIINREYVSERTGEAVDKSSIEAWVEDVFFCVGRAFSDEGRDTIRS